MDVENQIIKIRVVNFTEAHFKQLGYDVKNGDIITIPASDLPDGSGTKVLVECQYCKKLFKKSWRNYIKTKPNTCCDDCKKFKMMETSFEKYGNICSLQNDSVAAKRNATWDIKYGIGKNPLSSNTVRQKAFNTMINKYGVSHKTVNTSREQTYLCNLYNGIINYTIDTYIVDAVLPNGVVFEYDGYGHDMSVRMGRVSKEEFAERETNRQNKLLDLGYKIFRISYMNTKDKLPSDKILLGIIERAYMYFRNEYTFYKYDLKTMRESYSK